MWDFGLAQHKRKKNQFKIVGLNSCSEKPFDFRDYKYNVSYSILSS